MEKTLASLNKDIEALNAEMKKVIATGNKAAGTRARKILMEMIGSCKNLRKEIQEAKNEA